MLARQLAHPRLAPFLTHVSLLLMTVLTLTGGDQAEQLAGKVHLDQVAGVTGYALAGSLHRRLDLAQSGVCVVGIPVGYRYRVKLLSQTSEGCSQFVWIRGIVLA